MPRRWKRNIAGFRASRLLDLPQLRDALRPTFRGRLLAMVNEKKRLVTHARSAVAETFPQATLEEALDATSPGWRHWLVA